MESDEDPAPDEYEERIWWDDIEEEWRTDYPVPPHFIGSSRGKFGDSDYSRTLTADEQNLVEAEEAAALADEAAEDSTRRDLYFAELAGLVETCPPAEAGAQAPEGREGSAQESLRSACDDCTPAYAGEQESADPPSLSIPHSDLVSASIPGKCAPDE